MDSLSNTVYVYSSLHNLIILFFHVHIRMSSCQCSIIFISQSGESTVVIDNIHNIISAAAAKFNVIQMENLFLLVQKVGNLSY